MPSALDKNVAKKHAYVPKKNYFETSQAVKHY